VISYGVSIKRVGAAMELHAKDARTLDVLADKVVSLAQHVAVHGDEIIIRIYDSEEK